MLTEPLIAAQAIVDFHRCDAAADTISKQNAGHWYDDIVGFAKGIYDTTIYWAYNTFHAPTAGEKAYSLINWLSYGMVDNIIQGYEQRYYAMVDDPSAYNIANWASSGFVDMVNGTFNPERPLSFEHWMNSAALAFVCVSGYNYYYNQTHVDPAVAIRQPHPASSGATTVGNTADDIVLSPSESILKGKYANDLMNFEGNAQLLRLVAKLSYVIDQNGMNLSYPVLASFVKYPCSSSDIDKSKLSTKKTGYFTAEESIFTSICENLGLHQCRHPLAFLLEAADDIAYLSADIEDAQHKRIVSVSDLVWYLQKAYNASNDKTIQYVLSEMDRYRSAAYAVSYPDVDGYVIHRTRVLIKGIMIDAMYDSFNNLYKNIMQGTCEIELIAHSRVSKLAEVLRKIEREKIYYSKNIVESKTRAFTIISKILDVYVPAVLSHGDGDKGKDTAANLLYLSLSENYRFICETKNKEDDDENVRIYNRLLLVTDQLSGMTDSHAMTVYRAITAS